MSISAIAIDVIRVLILPPFSLFFVYGLGLLLRIRRPGIGSIVCNSAIAILFLLCTKAGAWLFVAPLEKLETPLISARDRDAQAIVILAAGRLTNNPEYGGQDVPDYIALARLRYGAKLQHETGLPVLVSGGLSAQGGDESLAGSMATALRHEFATPVKWTEEKSENTEQNAVFSANMLKSIGIRRIFLVTDAMHMRRAKIAFEKNGMQVVAAPTVFFSAGDLTSGSFVPSTEGLRRSQYALYEWFGLAWYAIRY